MDQRKQQRVCIKFCANLGKSATETLTMIQQAFRDQSLSRAPVFQWHARFMTGRTSVDDDDHTGRPTSCTTPETVAQIQQLVHQDRLRSIHIAEEVGIGYGTCQRVLSKKHGIGKKSTPIGLQFSIPTKVGRQPSREQERKVLQFQVKFISSQQKVSSQAITFKLSFNAIHREGEALW